MPYPRSPRARARSVARAAAAALALTAWLAVPCRAQDPTDPAAVEARGMELYENGAILYDEGRYEDAIVAWTEGYRLTSRPGFLYNIANAQERIADYEGAIDTLGRYRALAKAEERETLDRRIRNLEERIAQQRATPAPVVPGPAPIAAPAPQPRPTRSARPLVGGTLVGVGIVGIGAGTAFGLRSRAAGEEASASCAAGPDGLLCPDTAGQALGAARRDALLADIGFGVGAVLGVVGGVVLASPGDGAVALAVSPDRIGLVGAF